MRLPVFAKEYWDHRSVKKRNFYTYGNAIFGSRMGKGQWMGSPFLVSELAAAFPLRYAVLCGQLAEHESIQRRIQSGFSFKVRKGFFSFPCAALS